MKKKTPSKNNLDIGGLLRTVRNSREVSIRLLAKKAGISPAIVCRIEQGHTSPSFATLKKILDGLDMSFAEFFGTGDEGDSRSPVIRAGDMHVTREIGDKLKVTLVNAGYSKELQLFYEEYEPGAHWGSGMLTHRSVEAGICIEGTLTMELDGKIYRIEKGDGWFFDSTLPHRFSNQSDRKAVLVSANTPASF